MEEVGEGGGDGGDGGGENKGRLSSTPLSTTLSDQVQLLSPPFPLTNYHPHPQSSTCLYALSVGLCLRSQSARGVSLNDPVTPCWVCIALRVSASPTISTIPERVRGERGSGVRGEGGDGTEERGQRETGEREREGGRGEGGRQKREGGDGTEGEEDRRGERRKGSMTITSTVLYCTQTLSALSLKVQPHPHYTFIVSCC